MNTGREAPGLAVQLGRFAAVGAAGTLGYLALYWLLSEVVPDDAANAVALVTTAVASTEANRRMTFGVRGRGRLARDHAAGLAALGLALVLTTICLAAVRVAVPAASRPLQLAIVTAANAPASLARFAFLRTWILRPAGALRRRATSAVTGGS